MNSEVQWALNKYNFYVICGNKLIININLNTAKYM